MRLVQEQNLHFAFGDFDDHLEDVTIGKLSFFYFQSGCFFVCDELLFTKGVAYFTLLIDWLRNRTCLP